MVFAETGRFQAGGDGVFERLYHAALQQVVFLGEFRGIQASKRKNKEKKKKIYIYIQWSLSKRDFFWTHLFLMLKLKMFVCLRFCDSADSWDLETHLEALNFFVRASPICSPGGEEECRQTRQRLRGASRVGPTPPRPWKWSQWSHFLETKNSSPRALLEPNDPHEKYSRLWEEELLGITPWID